MTAEDTILEGNPAGVSETDEALMARYAAGDAEAFDALYRRHRRSVYCFIRRFCAQDDLADDLFQAVFVRLIRNRERYRPQARFTTWLFTLTRSVCIDAMRKSSRMKPVPFESGAAPGGDVVLDIPDPHGTARDVAHRRRVEDWIGEIVAALPREQREVFLLREHTSMTFEEIGRLAGCSANTAKSRMHYALLALRSELTRRGLNPNE